MTKKFALAAMAAALLSTTALAQSNPPAGSTSAPAAKPMDAGRDPVHCAGKWRASKLVGLNVYNANNEKIGDINELITDSSGKIDTVVIGAGGFLGMGEHNVGIPFSQVKFVNEPVKTSSTTTTSRRAPPARARRPPRDHDDDHHDQQRGQGLSRPCHGQHDQGPAQGAAGVQVRQRHLDDAVHHDGSGHPAATAPANPPAATAPAPAPAPAPAR